ncbi:hypothetical protein O2K51_12020 [Apibacter raozihei]|uniref:hypothetical protein n=1 Tax=Apibacter raozihei TaxID=2500547 RepID=UPI000FE42B75|nr:hypothetical protein [Apibacter raozihei]
MNKSPETFLHCKIYLERPAFLFDLIPFYYDNKKVDASNQIFNPKDFLVTLQKLKNISDYQNLGFTLKSLCKITQTTLLADLSFPNYTEHNQWDIYNILQLICSLIPKDELELLDLLNKEP